MPAARLGLSVVRHGMLRPCADNGWNAVFLPACVRLCAGQIKLILFF